MDEPLLCSIVVVSIMILVFKLLQNTLLADWGFGVGCTVEVTGLTSRCDLNGAWGIIKGFKNGRYVVSIEGEQGILAQRKNLIWMKKGVPTRHERVSEQSKKKLEIYNNTLVASGSIPTATMVLSDSVLVRQNVSAKESARSCFRVPFLKAAFSGAECSSAAQWSAAVSSPEYVKANGVSHPCVITEFSDLLRAAFVNHNSNCVLAVECDKVFVTTTRPIQRGEAINVLSCSPLAMSAAHGHFPRKKPDLRQCISAKDCPCGRGLYLGGVCFFCDEKISVGEERTGVEKWMSSLVFDMLTNSSKYSVTQSVACFELLFSEIGILHWASAATALLILEFSCSGLHRDTKLGESTTDRFRRIIKYLHQYCAFHDEHRPGTGLQTPGILTMLTKRQTGRIILRALHKTDKQTCRLLTDMLCPGVIASEWCCEDKNIYKEITNSVAVETQVAEEWGENPISDCGVEPVRVKAAVSKLQQAIKSKTDPLSDPYSHNQQSMDGHIDQILYGMGYDRGDDGEHDAGAYMSLLTKLTHGDEVEEQMRAQRSKGPTQPAPLI
eukprot:TRINITY_DN5802_c2_g1_i1.p1 TRINITY_DN5802_c2_g1~~TRINITY_DN5802_c2_g1_i1.p1  ORF type:complete len:587 (+),score=81.81 TRINITY_DN5802_c2_g1_i1:105-1763(+)